MLLPRLVTGIAVFLAASLTTVASSVARNPLNRLGEITEPQILTPNHRVNALSHFDLSFTAYHRRIKLSLEPNHDILAQPVHINYLDADGNILKTEPIDRLDHKVYKGEAWWQDLDGTWERVGWARITVHQDGQNPLFEGAFTIQRDHHHIQLASNYRQTKHRLDPWDENQVEEHMVIFRDSDIGAYDPMKADLKERDLHDLGDGMTCHADRLEFNADPQHIIYSGLENANHIDTSNWAGMSLGYLFNKRQIDSSTGAGNSGGTNLTSTIGSTNGCPNMRRVALVGVAYDCSYAATFNSTQSANANVIQQINAASSVYESTFNITLGLANLTSNDANCPSSAPASAPWNVPCTDNVDLSDRLNLFSAWRSGKQDNNSHWTLLTNCNTGSEVGLAWLGQACIIGVTDRNSTNGTQQSVAGANVVARTSTEWQVIAHETGHTFGAVHDCTSETCSDGTYTAQQCCPLSSSTCDAGEKYIMNPSTAQGITSFSACTVGNICNAMLTGSVKTSCLTNNKDVTLNSGPICGNGIVEVGEECDCGGTSGCGSDKCCNPTTCKYTTGSVCDDANDECCLNCQLKAAGTVCRASTGVCDPQEVCSGNSSSCPPDQTTPNGQSCGSGLACASGQCTSRDLQCKTLMGSYTQGNDTYACDDFDCTISCASPEFGSNVCYGLQQNFLDGTPCGGGGQCSNVCTPILFSRYRLVTNLVWQGQCKGSSFGKEIGSWIDEHKGLVIGIAAGLGGLLLLLILSCIVNSIRRRQQRKKFANQGWTGPPGPYGPAGFYGPGPPRNQWYGGGGPKPPGQDMGVMRGANAFSPPPQMGGWQQQQRQSVGQESEFSPPPGPPPARYTSVRYM